LQPGAFPRGIREELKNKRAIAGIRRGAKGGYGNVEVRLLETSIVAKSPV
jgi:hypothetical protein